MTCWNVGRFLGSRGGPDRLGGFLRLSLLLSLLLFLCLHLQYCCHFFGIFGLLLDMVYWYSRRVFEKDREGVLAMFTAASLMRVRDGSHCRQG